MERDANPPAPGGSSRGAHPPLRAVSPHHPGLHDPGWRPDCHRPGRRIHLWPQVRPRPAHTCQRSAAASAPACATGRSRAMGSSPVHCVEASGCRGVGALQVRGRDHPGAEAHGGGHSVHGQQRPQHKRQPGGRAPACAAQGACPACAWCCGWAWARLCGTQGPCLPPWRAAACCQPSCKRPPPLHLHAASPPPPRPPCPLAVLHHPGADALVRWQGKDASPGGGARHRHVPWSCRQPCPAAPPERSARHGSFAHGRSLTPGARTCAACSTPSSGASAAAWTSLSG